MRIAGALFIVLWIAACGQSQSDLCKQYIACQQEYDQQSQTGPVDVAQFEPDGLCWKSSDNAATCDQECTQGIAANQEASANANLDTPSCTAP